MCHLVVKSRKSDWISKMMLYRFKSSSPLVNQLVLNTHAEDAAVVRQKEVLSAMLVSNTSFLFVETNTWASKERQH